MLQTLISSARKNGLAKKTRALKGCLKKKILLFFSLGGREKNHHRWLFSQQKIATSFPFFHFFLLNAHMVQSIDQTRFNSTRENAEKWSREGNQQLTLTICYISAIQVRVWRKKKKVIMFQVKKKISPTSIEMFVRNEDST